MAENKKNLISADSFTVESPHAILFIFLTFGIGAIFRSIIRALNLHIPYTAIVFIFGGCVGWLSHEYTIFQEYTIVSNTEPKHILIAFLPALIFKTAFSLDAHTFLKSFPQVIIVAVPGFLISASSTGVIMKYLFDYKWSWEVAFLFGIIISTNYPYEVVALLRELGQSEHVSILLEGEALLTDGSAMVCFKILHGYITGQISDAELPIATSSCPSSSGKTSPQPGSVAVSRKFLVICQSQISSNLLLPLHIIKPVSKSYRQQGDSY